MTQAKPAATRRTTPKVADNDFDALRRKKKRKPARFDWIAYGVTWTAKRPNIAVAARLEDLDTVGSFVNYILAHIVKDQREDFLAKLEGDEDLDLDVIADMAESLQKVVYADLPT